MTQALFFMLVAAGLFGIGLYGLLSRTHWLRRILALNVMSNAVFLLLIALGRRGDSAATDPVPQAMVLTGIVIAISTTAFALMLARRLYRETGKTAPTESEVGDKA